MKTNTIHELARKSQNVSLNNRFFYVIFNKHTTDGAVTLPKSCHIKEMSFSRIASVFKLFNCSMNMNVQWKVFADISKQHNRTIVERFRRNDLVDDQRTDKYSRSRRSHGNIDLIPPSSSDLALVVIMFSSWKSSLQKFCWC